jgi:hypothetical protein
MNSRNRFTTAQSLLDEPVLDRRHSGRSSAKSYIQSSIVGSFALEGLLPGDARPGADAVCAAVFRAVVDARRENARWTLGVQQVLRGIAQARGRRIR